MDEKETKLWHRPLSVILPSAVFAVLALALGIFLLGAYLQENYHVYESETIAPTCTAQGYVRHTCRLCGVSYSDTFTAGGHIYSAPYTIREATAKTVGIRAVRCESCGNCRLTEIPPLVELPELSIVGDLSAAGGAEGAKVSVTYDNYDVYFTATALLRVQGFTSAGFPKKNYNIRLYRDEEMTSHCRVDLGYGSWGSQWRYTLKANYIDRSHARNIVSCRLFGQMTQTRRSTLEELLAAPNGGCTDGFPVRVTLNGSYYGLYTLNIPKNKWMFGMDEEMYPHSAILTAQMHSSSNNFRSTTDLYTTTDWSVNYCSTDTDYDWLNDSLNDLIRFVRDSDETTFRRHAAEHLDVAAVLDYTIMCFAMYGPDNWDKNMLLSTYDGKIWVPTLYDADCSFGLHWDGQSFYDQGTLDQCRPTVVTRDRFWTGNLLLTRTVHAFFDDFCNRYWELRETVLSEENIIGTFAAFFDSVPAGAYEEDRDAWRTLPDPTDPCSGEKNDLSQIRYFVRHRMALLDEAMENLRIE